MMRGCCALDGRVRNRDVVVVVDGSSEKGLVGDDATAALRRRENNSSASGSCSNADHDRRRDVIFLALGIISRA